MSKITDTLSKETVAAFRAELSESLIDEIGEHQFERLELLVAEAVAAALDHAAERVASLSRSLRTQADEGSDGLEL
jgi:hypothetical protein